MNAETIREMEAGRELDALVAEKVMKSHRWTETPPDYDGKHGSDKILMPKDLTWDEASPWLPPRGPIGHINLHHYSTDIAAAWEVVEKIHSRGWFADFCWRDDVCPGRVVWAIDFVTAAGKCVSADSESAPLAICRAALLAVMGES